MLRKREPTTPGAILREEFLKPLGLTQRQLADHLGCEVKVINRIVNGRTGVIQQNAEGEAREFLDQLAANPDAPPFYKALIVRLQSILAGDRDPALAADPEMAYRDAAELQLLLESLRPNTTEPG
ncbi:MAG TPA: hypothetical protein VKM72_30655 [Thermoanaerobaculia bacterium]|nr:hypothetical protein [Thermoanaerobaculia bacterium]